MRTEAQTNEDPRWQVVQRVLASPQLKSSVRLCKFLAYVTDCALRVAPEETTEQQIGIRVFGRRPGYNSSEDSIVRTHARLLRQKLAAYFAEDGKHEPLIFEIPKGHYLPVFHARELSVPEDSVPAELPQSPAEAASPLMDHPKWGRIALWSSVVLVVLLAAITFVWMASRHNQVALSPLDQFWHPFLTGDPPLVIYSNAQFVGDSTHGLRYATTAKPEQPDDVIDTYTGVGELASVYSLTRLFDSRHTQFVLKRSLLVTWDEARTNNLIFIGAPVENLSLRVLQPTTDFALVARPGSAAVVNLHPQGVEPREFSRPERPLTRDYAIIALGPSLQPGKRRLVFSGLMTYGTEAAVEYVCRPDYVADLLKHITGPNGEIHPFEAVIETSISGGVPLQSHLVALHVH